MPRSPSSSSSSSDDESRKRHTTASGSGDQSNPATRATQETADNNNNTVPPPVPMGYPPAVGYPPPHYHPYSTNAVHPYNPYGHPQNPGGHPPYYPGPGGSSFVRGFLAMIIALVLLTCAASILTWLILHPQIPVFRVENLSVAGFDLSGPQFGAEWAANVTMANPNQKLRIYFDQVQAFVYHKEDFLSSSGVDPVFLPMESRVTVPVRLKTNNTEQHLVARWVVDEMGRERSSGAVSFNLRMLVLATFKSGNWWTRHASMKVLCEDLRVSFVGTAINGVFINNGNKPHKCQVYYA